MKCTNCSWEGEEAVGPLNHCPICGDNTEGIVSEPKEEPKENILDLNGDGVFDSKDKKIAGKVLASGRRKSKRK